MGLPVGRRARWRRRWWRSAVVPGGGSPPRKASIAAAERPWSSSSGGSTKRRPRVLRDFGCEGDAGPGSVGAAGSGSGGLLGATGGTAARGGPAGSGATAGTGRTGDVEAAAPKPPGRGEASTAAIVRASTVIPGATGALPRPARSARDGDSGVPERPDPFAGPAGTKKRVPWRAVADGLARVRDAEARRANSARDAGARPSPRPSPRPSNGTRPRRGRSVTAPSKARFSSSASARQASRTSRDMGLRRRLAGIRPWRGRARRGD